MWHVIAVASLSAGAVRSLALYCTLVNAPPRSRQRQHTYRTMLTDSTRYCTAPTSEQCLALCAGVTQRDIHDPDTDPNPNHDPDHDHDPDRDHDPDTDHDHDRDPDTDRDRDPDTDRDTELDPDPDHDPNHDRDHDRDRRFCIT
jgi:hypothetical protein